MDTVNSRRLTSQDGFLQLFAKPGEYKYFLSTMPDGVASDLEKAFRLTVKPGLNKQGDGSQHDVKVYWAPDARRYVAEPDALEIAVNDYVFWHCESTVGSPAYVVRGTDGDGSFSSAALGPRAAFSHFFLTAGAVRYQVNGKGDYVIDVIDHRKVEKADYAKRAASAPVVQIQKGTATPGALEIVAGQSVIWTIENETAVTIASVPQAGRSTTKT